jgi:hypothetical protein
MFRRKTNTVGDEAAVAQLREQRSRAEAWMQRQREEQEEGAAALRAQERAEEQARLRRQREELAAQRAAEEYRKSPVGQAAVAFERGDQFLQLELSHAQVTGSTTTPSPPRPPRTLPHQEVRSDLLGQIEASGWRLLHANWVYVPTPRKGGDELPAGSGQVMGIYLFRRDSTLVGERVQRLDLNRSNGSVPAAERQAKHRVQEFDT